MKWTGIRPLLMANGLMVDPLNSFVKAIKQITRKGKRMTDADHEEVYRLKWEGSLYYDDKAGPFIPNDNIEACLKFGARKMKLGKETEAAILVANEIVPLQYTGPRTLEALWADGRFMLKKRTKLGTISVRPMFPTGWTIEFELEFDDRIINKKDLLSAGDIAGSQIGLGTWHPKFGRFLSEEI